MELSPLTAISPIDGRYHLKTQDLQAIFSEYGLIRFRVLVEVRWLQSLMEHPQIKELEQLSPKEHKFLDQIIENFSLEDAKQIKSIEADTNHDVKAVEYFLKQKLANNQQLAPYSEFIHFACTSEDINNLAYGLMLATASKQLIDTQLTPLINALRQRSHEYATIAMLSHTHGQAASPTTLGKEFANFVARLDHQIKQLKSINIMGKINGAVGNYNAHHVAYPDIDWQQHAQSFVTALGLNWNAYTTQIEPNDYIAELSHVLIRINSILIDFARDMWGYISLGYFKLQLKPGEVGSSTMPHKVNPIDFENAEGNLSYANNHFNHMAQTLTISRWQRDLTNSTLLRNLGVGFSHCQIAYQSLMKGINQCIPDKTLLDADLDRHWEVLAEAIQTMMRRYQLEEPYEQLKSLTRGQKIDPMNMHRFIDNLDLPEAAKKQLKGLTPHQYLGYAEKLAKKV